MPTGVYLSNDTLQKLNGDLFEQDARSVVADHFQSQVSAQLPDMVAQAQQDEAQRQQAIDQQRQQAEQASRDQMADSFMASVPDALAQHLGNAAPPESLQNGPSVVPPSEPTQTPAADLNAAPAPAPQDVAPTAPTLPAPNAPAPTLPSTATPAVHPITAAPATQTTAGLSGGGDLSGRVGARGQQIMSSAADSASWLGQDGQRAVQAVLLTEGGLAGARGDQGRSAGPLQFFEGGQLANFAQQHGLSLDAAKSYVEQNPEAAVAWAIGTPDAPGYLGRAIQAGQQAGLKGADLATYAQQHGQVSVSPERAGANYNALFAGGQTMASAPAAAPQDILAKVQPFLGSSYVWGGKSPNQGFDCSGLAGYLTTGQAESTGSLYGKSSAVGQDQAQPGDLVFWNMGSSDPHLQHVGVYLGNGQIVQSGGDQAKVNIGSVNQAIGSPPEFRRIGPGGAPAQAVAAQQQGVPPDQSAAATPTGQSPGLFDKLQQLGPAIGKAIGDLFGGATQAAAPAASAVGQGVSDFALGNSPYSPSSVMQGAETAAGQGIQAVRQTARDVLGAGPMESMQIMQDLSNKYPNMVTRSDGTTLQGPGANLDAMTPEDRQRYTSAIMAVGGLVAPLGAKFDKFGVAIDQSPQVTSLLKSPQYDQYGVATGFEPPAMTGALAPTADATAPTLGRDVASTLPPGSGPLAASAPPLESDTTLQGLMNMAKSNGIDTSAMETKLRPASSETNPFVLHSEPGPGRVALTEDDIADHIETLGDRYAANDARINVLENHLTGGSLTPGASGVVRPPWGVGWTNDALRQIAQQHGVSASKNLWWEEAGLLSGSGELRENVGQGGLRGTGSTQLTPTQARAEMARLIAENDQIMAATEVPEGATKLYRAAPPTASDLPWAPYTEASNVPTNGAGSNLGLTPTGSAAQTVLGTTANPSGTAANPPNAPASAGAATPLSLKPVTVGGAPPPVPPSPPVPATPPPPPPGSVPAAVGAVPPSVPTGGANAWDYLRALRVGSLAGGIQTIGHILLNAPFQTAFKLISDAPLSVTRPETIPLEFMGAWQGLRGWASNAATAPLGQPGKIAQSIGGTAGNAVETGLLGLVKTHPVIQDMASQIGTGMELWRRAGIEASNAGLARFSAPWWTEVQNLVANPTAEMSAAAQQAGDTFSLRGPMGEVGRAFAGLRGDSKLVDFIMPFFNIGYHVATQGIERSPLGLVGTAFDVARAPLGSGPYAAGRVAEGVTPLAQRFRNNMVGVGLAVEAFHQAAQGNITGNGPDDPRLKADLLATGWQPDSVRVGGRYFPLHVLGPLGWPLAEAANLYEATHTGEQGGYAKPNADLQSQFGSFAGRMAQYGENETFLRSIGQLLQAAGNAKDFGRLGEQEAASVLGSLIPQGALLSNIASTTDPYTRRPAPGDIGQAIENRLPGLRQDLPLKLTPTGSPVQNPSQGLGVLLPRSTIAAPDPVITAMGQAGVGAPLIPKTVSITSKYQMDLTPDEQQRFEELRGKALSDQLGDVVTDPDWKTLPVERQRVYIQRAMTAAADSARKQLLDELPDAQLESRAVLKSDAQAGNRVTVFGAP